MRTKLPMSDKLFNSRYQTLIKPTLRANLSLMNDLVRNKEVGVLILEARDKLGIPKHGRKPNTVKSFFDELDKLNIPEGLILSYSVKWAERKILNEYVDRIIKARDFFENFKSSIGIYIVHNLLTAPAHNVTLVQKAKMDGRGNMPDIHFSRMPMSNDWKIAELLLKRNKQIQDHLSDKLKKSVRGNSNLNIVNRVVREASNRVRKSSSEAIKITNSEIADLVYGSVDKVNRVNKILYRQRKKAREI